LVVYATFYIKDKNFRGDFREGQELDNA